MWIQDGFDCGVSAVVFSPDGQTLYSGDGEGWVRAWDVATRKSRELYRRAKPDNNNRGVYELWPTSDGSRLLVPDEPNPIDALHPDAGPLLTIPKGRYRIDCRYLLPDGRRLMSVESECRVGLWDIETGKRLKVPGTLGKATNITYHQLLPDGVTLLTNETSSNALPLWDFRTGKRVGELPPTKYGTHPSALSADGVTWAVGQREAIWLYDVPARSLRHKLRFPKNIRQLAFHPNNCLLASTSTNSVITFWDVVAGEQVRQYDWDAGKVESIAFAPDGLTCAAGMYGQFVVFDVDL